MTVYVLTHMWVFESSDGGENGTVSTLYVDKSEVEKNFFEKVEEFKTEYQEKIQSDKYEVYEDTNEYAIFNFDKPNDFTESVFWFEVSL